MRNFYDMIREQAADRLALIEEGKEYTYGELVKIMAEHDLARAKREAALKGVINA